MVADQKQTMLDRVVVRLAAHHAPKATTLQRGQGAKHVYISIRHDIRMVKAEGR